MINGTMYKHEPIEGDLSCNKCVAVRSGGLCGSLQAQLPHGCLSSSVWAEVYTNKPRKKHVPYAQIVGRGKRKIGEANGQKSTDKATNTATKA